MNDEAPVPQVQAATVHAAALGDQATEPREKALVARWEKTLMQARKGDKAFRKRVVRDRKFATGEALAGYEVSTNLVQATIDTLIPFLYAKDPDVDVVPQDQVSPPPVQRPVPPKPPLPPVGPDGMPMVALDGMPISPDPAAMAQYQLQLAQFEAEQQALAERAQVEREQNDMVRRLSQTIEIVVSRLWHKAKLKAEAKRWLRGGMTSAEGWLKVSMQGDLKTDPQVQKELHTLQEQLAAITALQKQVDENTCKDYDASVADLQGKIAGAEQRLETYVGRCLAIDWIDTLDMQTPQSLRQVSEYVNSPWLADATYYSVEEACARFEIDAKKLASAARWKAPAVDVTEDGQPITRTDVSDEGDAWTRTTDADSEGCVRVWEINAKSDNQVFTWIEGTDFWAKPPQAPRFQTTRWYPYFLLALYECDAERHPQSLSWRLSKLQDEFCSARSNFAEVRRRAKQSVMFDATNISPGDADKITGGQNQEFIPIKPVRPGEPLGNSFAPKPYNSVDAGLYETGPIRADMETVSGAQDALRQGAVQPKTATQAEIENTGGMARTGYSRDCLDMGLDDMALYTAELALQAFTPEQVRRWAGPHAVWPQGMPAEQVEALVSVAIRAGSTGKPNTTAERNAWSALLPILQGMIQQIGQLRGADPQELGDKLTELLRETVLRTGERIDVDRFLPMPGASVGAGAPAGPMSPPAAPSEPIMGPPSPTALPSPPVTPALP